MNKEQIKKEISWDEDIHNLGYKSLGQVVDIVMKDWGLTNVKSGWLGECYGFYRTWLWKNKDCKDKNKELIITADFGNTHCGVVEIMSIKEFNKMYRCELGE